MRIATVLLLFALNITSILGSNVPPYRDVRSVEGAPIDAKAPAVQHKPNAAEIDIEESIKKNAQPVVSENKNIVVSNGTNASQNGTTSVQSNVPRMPGMDDKLQSGALLRGFFVLLGATVLLLVYLGVRMFRLSKVHKAPSMVRKYGVLTNRTDVEMLPLPLSEDEDDDTVFEINNHMDR